MARWLQVASGSSRPGSLPGLGAQASRSWLPLPPFPHSYSPRNNPSGLCLTPGNILERSSGAWFPAPFELGRQMGPAGPLPWPEPTPCASHRPRPACQVLKPSCVACLGQGSLLSCALESQTSPQATVTSCPCCPPHGHATWVSGVWDAGLGRQPGRRTALLPV